MSLVYEVRWWDIEEGRSQSQEYDNERAARTRAKYVLEVYDCDQVEVITWVVSPNLPRLKPDYVYRSASMAILKKDGKWYMASIHGPHFELFPEDE
jgi:hypothetical protein